MSLLLSFYIYRSCFLFFSNFLILSCFWNMTSSQSDGWDSTSQIQIVDLDQHSFIKFRGQKGLNILQSNFYSLEPDMFSGWKPKLPSCPLPLSYKNIYVDSLKKQLGKRNEYEIVYVGHRFSNSVQVNKNYKYYWKYRSKYEMKLNVVQNAINSVGNQLQERNMNEKYIKKQQPHIFDSKFESGNLDLVVKVKNNQYDCFIRSDTNTRGHSNWYFFSVQNKRQVGPIKINICNMTKWKNLYSKGMKPYCRIFTNGVPGQWSQDYSYDVQFVERFCRYGFEVKTYQLQFKFNFTQPYQTVHFSYSIPYTYTDLSNFISQIKSYNLKYVKITQLCQSLSGVALPLIRVGMKNQMNGEKKRGKTKVAIITARIHPGQSNSSYLIEGFVRRLLNNSKQSNYLLNSYVFYIVPMLNPDGVIIGNFRTSYSGKDLNRQFHTHNKYIFPEVYALKQLCQKIKSFYNHEIDVFFDFHGHSSKQNLFCYGPEHKKYSSYFYKARALAKFMAKANEIFSYEDSIFTISEQKKNTARAYMFRIQKIPLSFTFEISNGIYENSMKVMSFLNKNVLLQAGAAILKGFFEFTSIQIKFPIKQIRAKVDSGKYQRRLNFDKNFSGYIQSENDKKTEKGILNKRSTHKSSKMVECDSEKQIIQIMNEIKSERLRKGQKRIQEGRSDSESELEDLSKEEEARFFNYIVKERKIQNYNNFNQIPTNQYFQLNLRQKPNISNELAPRLTENSGKKYFENKTFSFSAKSSKKKIVSVQKSKIIVVQKPFCIFL